MIVLTAATTWEARPLKRLGVPVWETGVGPKRAAKFLAARPAPEPESIVISSGFAGALQPGLRCTDLIMDPHEAPVALAQGARETAQSLGMRLHMGRLHSVDHIVGDPGAKRELGTRLRAAAVDMETGAVRDWCARVGATALGLRVILDEVDDPLPTDMPEDGSFRAGARYALARPTRIPSLIRLGVRQKRAMNALVEFLTAFLPQIPDLYENPHAE